VIETARRFLRQRFGSPAMAIALGVLALLTAAQATFSGPEQALGSGFFAILILSAGVVSRDVSSGALQMILARPIRRTSYLYGRYAGILAAYAVFLAVAGTLSILFAFTLPRLLGAPQSGSPPFAAIGRGAASAFLDALLFAAVLLFFSTFLRGYADVLAYFLLSMLLGILPGLGAQLRNSWLTRAGETIRRNVLPNVEWGRLLRGENVLGEPTGRWLLAVTLFLVLAALIFSRREFSYGQD
jgi:hypothetical protein